MDPDASRCPLCGEGNECALVEGRDGATCWCVADVFPTSLLEQVSNVARGQVCICEACARKHAEQSRKHAEHPE